MLEAVLFVVILIPVLIAISRARRVKFDRERRELLIGWQTPIPFADLEVRMFGYRLENESKALGCIMGGLWSGMASGTQELHQVYLTTGDGRVNLKRFRSKKAAAQYADEIRKVIAGT